MSRPDDQLRPISIERHYLRTCPGSVLYRSGGTTVLCTASVLNEVPPFLVGKGKGWITAEYEMLPAATTPRRRRDRSGKIDGRTTEIQRLIGRSLRAVADLTTLGERTLAIDCDVLEADGGTRTAAISGSLVALVDAIAAEKEQLPDPTKYPLRDSVAAVSVGIVKGVPTLDLDYPLDVAAEVDMNVVMTGAGRFVEVQGTGEEATFGDDELAALLSLAKKGIREIREKQKAALGDVWPFA